LDAEANPVNANAAYNAIKVQCNFIMWGLLVVVGHWRTNYECDKYRRHGSDKAIIVLLFWCMMDLLVGV
jgi:hypothetical protein